MPADRPTLAEQCDRVEELIAELRPVADAGDDPRGSALRLLVRYWDEIPLDDSRWRAVDVVLSMDTAYVVLGDETPAFQRALGVAIRDFLGVVDDAFSDHSHSEHGLTVNRLARLRRAHATIGAAIAEWESEAASDD
jgi:hypothetical protein